MPLILTLCGSLRTQSSNRSLLGAAGRLAPVGVAFDHYTAIDRLPHFNPDIEHTALPVEVADLRRRVGAADAILISCPEYARGIPGSFKNALDWLVSFAPFAGKPVVILQAARGSTWAADSLREILKTMSAVLVEEASVSLPLGTNQMDEAGIVAREDLRVLIGQSIEKLLAAVGREGRRTPDSAPHSGAV